MPIAIRWLAIASFVAAPCVAPAASFTGIGTPSAPTVATGISPDGSKVVGYFVGASGNPGNAFVWDSIVGLRAIDPPSGVTAVVPSAASVDGSTIVGWSEGAIGERPALRRELGDLGMSEADLDKVGLVTGKPTAS